ncbi:aspartyl-phosphate phosphatase Spo0E family protein [Serpentinicella alkaliphila]|uniref:aspartyl-phosphate phosphatase Spo0E family protein n=1 Tax=Serpentinicella alkaliphila TaxID=1734049 RepID=UPI001042F29F|nr:aspartyl-phosphate phosphatase Spo0E family protein [Serpentinicella alkaliphila]QUH26779.1 aspartyl-phosphate phosphatase Spo0E family protein [Serpentinicella alkaliphila]
MIKNEIIKLRKQLNDCINKEMDYSIIYDLSVQLDQLISAYYKSAEGKKAIN